MVTWQGTSIEVDGHTITVQDLFCAVNDSVAITDPNLFYQSFY